MSEKLETIKAMYGKVDGIMKEIIKCVDTLDEAELKELAAWLKTDIIRKTKEDNNEKN